MPASSTGGHASTSSSACRISSRASAAALTPVGGQKEVDTRISQLYRLPFWAFGARCHLVAAYLEPWLCHEVRYLACADLQTLTEMTHLTTYSLLKQPSTAGAAQAYLGSVPEPALHLEADHAPEAIHLLDGNGVVGVTPQAGVVHPPDVGMAFQPA